MPSSKKAYQAVDRLIDESETGPIIDLGSGWGNLVIRMAKQYPQREVIGYELSMLPWLTTSLLKYIFRLKNLTVYKQDFYHADLSCGSVLVCYLFPAAMAKIKLKLALERPKINYLISNNFALPASQFEKVIQLDDFYKSPVYLYRVNDS